MANGSFDLPRSQHTSAPAGNASPSRSSAVEEIWSSWRYAKATAGAEKGTAIETFAQPKTFKTNVEAPEERVRRLRRRGEDEQALRFALAEILREEEDKRMYSDKPPSVPWYYWEAAEIYRKLKRYNDEIALVKRFAKNYNIHFRVFSKRYRSTRGATHSWATHFLERIDSAKEAAAGAENKKENKKEDRP